MRKSCDLSREPATSSQLRADTRRYISSTARSTSACAGRNHAGQDLHVEDPPCAKRSIEQRRRLPRHAEQLRPTLRVVHRAAPARATRPWQTRGPTNAASNCGESAGPTAPRGCPSRAPVPAARRARREIGGSRRAASPGRRPNSRPSPALAAARASRRAAPPPPCRHSSPSPSTDTLPGVHEPAVVPAHAACRPCCHRRPTAARRPTRCSRNSSNAATSSRAASL